MAASSLGWSSASDSALLRELDGSWLVCELRRRRPHPTASVAHSHSTSPASNAMHRYPARSPVREAATAIVPMRGALLPGEASATDPRIMAPRLHACFTVCGGRCGTTAADMTAAQYVSNGRACHTDSNLSRDVPSTSHMA